jgi:DNA-directed RNA polymerase alpha subunit
MRITKERLLICGFYEYELELRIQTDRHDWIVFNSDLFCWVNKTKKPIKFMHQLQNLYFALTQEELKFPNNISTQKTIVTDLNISVRLMNCLKHEGNGSYYNYGIGFTYLEEISNYTKKEVYKIRNFGAKSMFELEDIMLKFDIKFRKQ